MADTNPASFYRDIMTDRINPKIKLPFIRLDDPNYAGMLQLDSANLKIYYSRVFTDTGANAMSIKAVCQGLAWLSIGVNPRGEMSGGQVVIGLPNATRSSVNPGKYSIFDYADSGVVLMGRAAQTLINRSITQDSSAETTTLMAVIAWAFLTPFALGSAFVRSLLPIPLWFKLHMYFNFGSFVLTLTAFILAVVNVEPEDRFSDPHIVAGWVLMGLMIVQVVAGI
jgi:hypothetical protein